MRDERRLTGHFFLVLHVVVRELEETKVGQHEEEAGLGRQKPAETIRAALCFEGKGRRSSASLAQAGGAGALQAETLGAGPMCTKITPDAGMPLRWCSVVGGCLFFSTWFFFSIISASLALLLFGCPKIFPRGLTLNPYPSSLP